MAPPTLPPRRKPLASCRHPAPPRRRSPPPSQIPSSRSAPSIRRGSPPQPGRSRRLSRLRNGPIGPQVVPNANSSTVSGVKNRGCSAAEPTAPSSPTRTSPTPPACVAGSASPEASQANRGSSPTRAASWSPRPPASSMPSRRPQAGHHFRPRSLSPTPQARSRACRPMRSASHTSSTPPARSGLATPSTSSA